MSNVSPFLINKTRTPVLTDDRRNLDIGLVDAETETLRVTVELIAYLDRNFVEYLWYELDFSNNRVLDYILHKWNTVETALSNVDQVGARIKIALRKIVLWVPNPPGYPVDEVGVHDRLKWFCRHTRETDHFDQKILYTKGTGGSQMGLAYVSGSCKNNQKCYLAKSKVEDARIEIHEMGHNLGLNHDPVIGDCSPEGGFMGWGFNYRFLPCYKRVLMQKFRSSEFGCLFRRNVQHDEFDDNN